ncbi:Histone H1, partial [Pseudocercospora fuligena]
SVPRHLRTTPQQRVNYINPSVASIDSPVLRLSHQSITIITMPPKKASTGTKTAAPKAAATHSSYLDMIKEAVISLKERSGSSRQAIKKYVLANNNLAGVSDNAFTVQFNKALQKGSDNGTFLRPKDKAPAVEDKAPVVLGKTKSGRVTKSKAPQPVAKTTAPKKKAAAKKATPKKSATPKKA